MVRTDQSSSLLAPMTARSDSPLKVLPGLHAKKHAVSSSERDRSSLAARSPESAGGPSTMSQSRSPESCTGPSGTGTRTGAAGVAVCLVRVGGEGCRPS